MKYFILCFFLFIFISCSTSNYYLVRHAEKVDNSKDPVLSPAGEKRAEALKEKLLNAEIDLLYATSYQRTQQTVQPLANALNKKIITYDAQKTWEFVEGIKKLKNKNVVVAGHSNTIPEMVLQFTGDTVHIGHDDYFHLFLIQKRQGVFRGKYELIEMKYGE